MSTATLAPLHATFKRLHHFSHLASIAGWDQAAMMPAKGNESRAAAMAELQVLMHQTLTDPALPAQFEAAAKANLSDTDQASLAEMRRDWAMANRLPQDLVEAQSLAAARCEHAWRTQRKANDWVGFARNLSEVVKLARQEAHMLADATGVTPYEALMDKFEPGMRESTITALFGEVKTWLPGLITQVMERQQHETVVAAIGPFPVERQRALGVDVMGLLGFDFEGGRLDISTHPFCGGVPQDVRITTRYSEATFAPSLSGIIHETGHARYEQRLPRDTLHLPVGRARSMGVPTLYVRLLGEPNLTREACAHMRLFISGSAPLLIETFNAFRERTGHTILERYGMSETIMLTSNPCRAGDGERVGGTVGKPLPGVRRSARGHQLKTCF